LTAVCEIDRRAVEAQNVSIEVAADDGLRAVILKR
jgi:hypothetical protein